MTPAEEKHLSTFLSLVLRHDPAAADITLDAAGWVLIEALIQGATRMSNILDLRKRCLADHLYLA